MATDEGTPDWEQIKKDWAKASEALGPMPLKFAARPKEITIEQLFPTGNYLNLRVGMTWSVGDENPTDVMQAAMDICNNFHRAKFPQLYDKEGKPKFHNYTGEEAPVIQNQSPLDKMEEDFEFNEIKKALEKIEFREDAQAYLDTTDFRMAFEAKKLVNAKPIKK